MENRKYNHEKSFHDFRQMSCKGGSVVKYLIPAVAIVTIAALAYLEFGIPRPLLKDVTLKQGQERWSIYENKQDNFTFRYPPGYEIGTSSGKSVAGGLMNDGEDVVVYVTIPKADYKNTNLSDARLIISMSEDQETIAECVSPIQSDMWGTKPAVVVQNINGVQFSSYYSNDAGLGNYYESTFYRTVRDRACYELNVFIHLTSISNYEPNKGIKEFNRVAATQVLTDIVSTF